MIIFLFSLIIFVLVSVLTFFSNNLFTRIFYTTVAVWLGFAFYLLLASCLYSLVLVVFKIFNGAVSLEWFGVLCLVTAIFVSIYGVLHARTIVIKNINVTLPNLPPEWEKKKAVWISDVHLGAVNGQKFAKKIVLKINELHPDIIFIGGDLYDGVKVDESAIIKPFADLVPALGTCFITGNHEEFRDRKHYLETIRSIGIRVLDNEMMTIDGLQLIGVDDRDSISPAKFESTLSGLNINKNKPSILLKHQPSQLEEAEKMGISLQISGHTHRGQVSPFNIFTSLIFKGYDYGLKMQGQMAVYTSSGVGTWGPPLRVRSESEIVVFKFINKI